MNVLFDKPLFKQGSVNCDLKYDNDKIFGTLDARNMDIPAIDTIIKTIKLETDEENITLPALNVKDVVNVKNAGVKENITKPKSRYNVGSITDLMEKYNIGRPSTMGEIVKKCIDTGVIELVSKGKKKEYRATDFGKSVIKVIPDELKSTDLCNRVEKRIEEVRKGNLKLSDLQQEVYKEQEDTLKRLNNQDSINSFKTEMSNNEVIGKL